MKPSRKDEIILEAEKEITDMIPRLKGMHGSYINERDYRSIRNLALAANSIRLACMQIMRTFEHVDEETRLRDYELLN